MKYCERCGTQCVDEAMYCPNCGNKFVNNANNVLSKAGNLNILCLIGFIVSFISSIAGLICSIIGLSQIKKSGETGRGFAIAGVVISAVKIVLVILVWILFIAIWSSYIPEVYY